MSAVKRALRQFAFGAGKTAGRNSSGRITSFHRGGGAKRLQRTVDLKRNSAPSSMGVVERIEYDPNRSSSIALIRWVHGVNHHPLSRRAVPEKLPAPPPRKWLEFDPASSSAAAVDGGASSIRGVFALNSMLPQQHAGTASRDVFLTAFSPKRGSGSKRDFGSESHSLGLPRIAVAAASAAYFAPRARGEEDALKVRNWKRNSDVWVNRNKRKAAISWHSIAR